MNIKTNKESLVLFVITVIAAPLSVHADVLEDSVLINVSGTEGVDGGHKVFFELTNRNGVAIGSSSYTTRGRDDEDRVANRLKRNYAGAGFSVARKTDKDDGTEVILVKRKRNGGQSFKVEASGGESAVTVTSKEVPQDMLAMFVQPDVIDRSTGFATITLTGEGTNWLNQPLTGIDFGDDIFVDSFDILANDLIVSNISWDPGALALGPEHVLLLGDYFDDSGLPLYDIGYELSWNPLDVTPEPGSLALIALGGLALANRRRHQPLG